MLHMKLGVPIYDNFREENIDDMARFKSSSPVYLLVNSNNQATTGILAQLQSGRLSILWDAIVDGDSGTVLTDVIGDALIAAHQSGVAESPQTSALTSAEPPRLRLLSPQRHFDDYTIYGLRAAARKAGYDVERGGEAGVGREEIRALLRRVSHGGTALAVSPRATWTLRAFAGGYARDATSALPIDNAYATLMEALEAFAARMRVSEPAMDTSANYAYTPDGRKYLSALVKSHG
jgi:hypothetical protein